jgi:LysM repeat protein
VANNPAEPTILQRPVPVKPEKPIYPTGEFKINQTRVVYLPAGTSLLAVAEEFDIPYARLLDFNDMKDVSLLDSDQLIYLQRKRKQGSKEFHVVEEGESLYLISQAEGIRLEALAELNLLTPDVVVAAGEKLNLKSKADARPILQSEVVQNIQQEAAEPLVTTSVAMDTPPARHIVKTKETLYSISKMYGVELEKLQEWNRLDTTDLRIGQELVIIKN